MGVWSRGAHQILRGALQLPLRHRQLAPQRRGAVPSSAAGCDGRISRVRLLQFFRLSLRVGCRWVGLGELKIS